MKPDHKRTKPVILAAIDIGSNAARLLISEAARYKDGTTDFTKLNLIRVPLRLGFDVFEKGIITPEKQQMMLKTMKAFATLMDIYKVEKYRACATSAMRDAGNGKKIIEDVEKQTGITIEIIHGQEEANLIYETHVAENLHTHKSYLYIDVGGGSTEITLFSKNNLVFKQSFNIGTIRLLQNSVELQQWEYLKWYLKTHTELFQPIEAIGTGGNINKIFSLSKRKEGKPLPYELLKHYHKQLATQTLEERMHEFNLREDRADVIVPALQIYLNVMRWCKADDIYVPKMGLADGIIKMLYRQATQNL